MGGGGYALLLPPLSSPPRSWPSPRSAPSPTPARQPQPQPPRSPLPPAPNPPPHPHPAAAPRVIFIRNIPKSVPLAQAEPRAASAYLRATAAALGKGRGRGCGGGEGGWGGWEGGSKPPQSALGERCRSSEAATLCAWAPGPRGLPPARRLG